MQQSLDVLRMSDIRRRTETAAAAAAVAQTEGLFAESGRPQGGDLSTGASSGAASQVWSEASTAGRSTSSLGFQSDSESDNGSGTSDRERKGGGAAFGGADLATIGRLVLRLDRVVVEVPTGGSTAGVGGGGAAALFEVLPEDPEEERDLAAGAAPHAAWVSA
jgi:hypothetical protein